MNAISVLYMFLILQFYLSLTNAASIEYGRVSQGKYSTDAGNQDEILGDLELKTLELSHKLKKLYARLDNLDTETVTMGFTKFHQILTSSKSSEDFLNKLLADVTNSSDETSESNVSDIQLVKTLLEDLMKYLEKHNPKVLDWMLSTVYGDGHTVTDAQIGFLEAFSKIDKELSRQSFEWNKYWTYLFKIIGNYIVSHG